MADKCKVCGKPVAEWYVVCSYACTGSLGGRKKGDELKSPKGFAANRTLAAIAGSKGGKISRRGKAKPKTEPRKNVIKQIMEKIDVRLR